jgi:hypothetical protein
MKKKKKVVALVSKETPKSLLKILKAEKSLTVVNIDPLSLKDIINLLIIDNSKNRKKFRKTNKL